MKRLFFVLALVLLAATQAMAVTAIWEHSGSYPNVTGYHLYWGTTPGAMTSKVDMAASACTPDPVNGGDCHAVIPDSSFAANTVYYFSADAWAYGADGITVQTSPQTASVQFKLLPDGTGISGTPPAPPSGIGVFNDKP